MTAIIRSFAWNEYAALYRAKFPFVWFLVLPAVASAILGPAVAGLDEAGATGRVLVGFGVMFSYMSVNYVGHALYREYHANTWRRTAIAAPPKSVYLAGKTLPVLTITLGQLGLFSLFAVAVLDLPLADGGVMGTAQLAVIIIPLAITGVATGALLFTYLRRAEVFFSLTYLILMVLASMGGALVPAPQLPGWSQAAGHLTPHHWAMRAFDEITLGAGSWSVVLRCAVILWAIGIALTIAASARLDLRRECYAV